MAQHMKTFMGGKMSPAELHRKMVFKGQVCSTCGDKAALAAKFMMEEKLLLEKNPAKYLQLMQRFGGDPAFDTKYGKMVITEVMFACDRCKDAMRKFAAQQKDHVLVEFDEAGLEESYSTQVGSKS